jgi:hypothetical protein
MIGLTKENAENNNSGYPPRAVIPFEIDGSNVSFRNRGSDSSIIKIKRKDGSYQINPNQRSSMVGKMSCNSLKRATETITKRINSQRISISTDKSKKNIFTRPLSTKTNES